MSSLPPLPTFPLHEQSAKFAANRPPPLTLHSPPETPSKGKARYSTLPTPFPHSPTGTTRQNFSNSPVSPQSENGSSGIPASLSSEGREDRTSGRREPAPSSATMSPTRSSTVSYPAVPQSTTPPVTAPAQAPPPEHAPPVPPLPSFVPAFQTLPSIETGQPRQQLNGQQSPQPGSPRTPRSPSTPRSPMSLRNAGHPEGEIQTQTVEFAFELAADPSPPQSGHLQSPAQQQAQNMQHLEDPDRDRRLSYITTPPGSPPVPQTPHTPRLPYTAEEPTQHPDQFFTTFQGAHQPPPIPAPIYVPPAPMEQLTYPPAAKPYLSPKPKRISTTSSSRSHPADTSTYQYGLFLSCIMHPLIAIWACISPCTLHTSTQKMLKPDSSRNGFCGSLLFLPIYPFATLWRRMEVREKYGLRSAGCAEFLGACFACWCFVVQDYTEVRRREAGRGRPRQRDLEMGGVGYGR